MVEVRFEVTGDGDFPVDLLRHDRCFPDTERDSYRVLHSGVRTVTLRSVCRGNGWTPDEGAWSGAGWKIEPGSLVIIH